MPDAYVQLERSLGPALAVNRAGSTVDHVLVTLPSFSLNESILSHYGDRVVALEHRYLNALVISARIPSCEILYVSTRRPDPAILDYYRTLIRPDMREAARTHVMDVDDGTSRSVAAKLHADPAKLEEIRRVIAGRPAFIEPWNVTDQETALAVSLGIPINGTRPELRHLGFKSEGRRIMREAGAPVPFGVEDVHDIGEVAHAIGLIQATRPAVEGVVVKLDDSGAGDGNQVLDLRPMATCDDPDGWLRARLDGLPVWYLDDLRAGGVVEERITGERFASPSCQADIRPDGSVQILATHEQVLGGADGQVYLGCRFPADPAYAATLARHTQAIGERLAAAGALGRIAVDFVAAVGEDGRRQVHAIEINLRKGGTTHPYAVMRNLIPGRYDVERGAWVVAHDGSTRCYAATDNLVDPSWQGLTPAEVIAAVRAAGLDFEHETHTGAVLHMLTGLGIDGRFGLTAIGTTPNHATAIQAGVEAAVHDLAAARRA